MRWIVGIDLLGGSRGALHMAAWLRAASGNRDEIIGVHVPDLRAKNGADDVLVERIGLSVEEHVLRATIEEHVDNPFVDRRVVDAPAAELGLELAVRLFEADGVLIGGPAPRRGGTPGIIGRTTRRLLRRLPAPLMIVPRELRYTTVGGGPLVLATDLTPRSASAARFARSLAEDLGHRLLAVSVDAMLSKLEQLAEWFALVPRPTSENVATWLGANDVGDAQIRVDEGDTVERVLSAVRDVGAPVVVCGSHCLGDEPVYCSSTGLDLARHADCATLVVPPSSVMLRGSWSRRAA